MSDELYWKPVVGYEGKYEVSMDGEIKTVGRGRGRVSGRIIAQATMPRGYKVVSLWKDNIGETWLVHRLVVFAFIGDIPDGMQVNHKNGIKADNSVANLEIMTNDENRQHAIDTGLRDGRGEDNPMATITEETVRQIRKCHAEGMGYKKLAKHFGLTWGCVRSVAARKNWKHVE